MGGERERDRERDRASYRGGCDKTRCDRLGVRLDSACDVERAKNGERRGGRKMVVHVVTGANDTKEGTEHTCRTARHVTEEAFGVTTGVNTYRISDIRGMRTGAKRHCISS